MTRTVYLNGDWLPETEAKVSVFDRGFLFADTIYEMTAVVGGRLIDHAATPRACSAPSPSSTSRGPLDPEALLTIRREVVARNHLVEGLVYFQISRGVADRDVAYPAGAEPALVLFTQAKPVPENPRMATGITIALLPDQRWTRRDGKTAAASGTRPRRVATVAAEANGGVSFPIGLFLESGR